MFEVAVVVLLVLACAGVLGLCLAVVYRLLQGVLPGRS